METMNNTEMHKIMEMAFHLYATSEDVPECPLDQDLFLEQAMATATEFTQRWQDAGLSEERLLEGFCNDYIRDCIMMNIHLHIPFSDEILDQLEKSWNARERLSRQRQILRLAEKKHHESSL